jgi:hypothetical protein
MWKASHRKVIKYVMNIVVSENSRLAVHFAGSNSGLDLDSRSDLISNAWLTQFENFAECGCLRKIGSV